MFHAQILLMLYTLTILMSCTDFSSVTDPATRQDIAQWYSSSNPGKSSSSALFSFSSSSISESSFNWNQCKSKGMCGTFYDTRLSSTTEYKWVTIGNQTWMAENLAYLPSINATENSYVLPKYYVFGYMGTEIETARTTNSYFYFGSTKYYLTGIYSTFGTLYNFPAAKAACPNGWHLPDTTEWKTLITSVGGADIAGTELKGTTNWEGASLIAGQDNYGFTALPGGNYTTYVGAFLGLGSSGSWWSSSTENDSNAYYYDMQSSSASISQYSEGNQYGRSVRCIKDSQ